MMGRLRFRKPDVSMALNGVMATRPGSTAGCANLSETPAILTGFVPGGLVLLSVEFIDKVLKVDDPVGALSGTFPAAPGQNIGHSDKESTQAAITKENT